MPPFDFGKQTGRAFQQSFQAAQDRKQKAKRQRALQRFRQKRLEQNARLARERMNRRDERAREGTIEVDRSVPWLPGNEGKVRVDAGTAARQRRRTQKMTMMQMRELLQQPETIEVQRQNVPQLPGEGPARVDPNTMIRHSGGSGGVQGGSGGSQGGGAASLPDSHEATQEEIDRLVEQEQKALEAGVSSDSLAETQRRILQLKKHRDSLRGGDPRLAPAQPDTTQPGMMELRTSAQGDTSRTDTTAAADSTTTQSPGRTPQTSVPSGLGADRRDAPGGGGGTHPSAADPRLRYGGQPGSTELLVEEAKGLALEQGPDVVRRRLDSLLEKGRIDRSTRDSVHARALGELMRVQREMGQ